MSNRRYPWTFPQDNNGRVISDPLGHFKASDLDASSDPSYYGFLAADGTWYITKYSDAGSTVRYSTGSEGYTTAWTSRASLGYDYFDVIF